VNATSLVKNQPSEKEWGVHPPFLGYSGTGRAGKKGLFEFSYPNGEIPDNLCLPIISSERRHRSPHFRQRLLRCGKGGPGNVWGADSELVDGVASSALPLRETNQIKNHHAASAAKEIPYANESMQLLRKDDPQQHDL
jgi:hypothetical protein